MCLKSIKPSEREPSIGQRSMKNLTASYNRPWTGPNQQFGRLKTSELFHKDEYCETELVRKSKQEKLARQQLDEANEGRVRRPIWPFSPSPVRSTILDHSNTCLEVKTPEFNDSKQPVYPNRCKPLSTGRYESVHPKYCKE